MSIEIHRLIDHSPTNKNIEQIVGLTAQDLREATKDLHEVTLTDEEILAIADQDNPELVEAQQTKVAEHPERYTGAFQDTGDLVAMSMINEWYKGDDVQFSKLPMAAIFDKIERRLTGPHLRGEPFGIFALAVSAALPNREEVGHKVLQASLEGKDSSQVRIALRRNDPLTDVVRAQGFEPTGKRGVSKLGIPEELHIRPPKEHSEQDQ